MKTVAIVGIGVMGSAIAQRIKPHFGVIGLDLGSDLSEVKDTDIIVIAVKPQSFGSLAKDLKKYIKGQTIVSIMAGISCEQISEHLNTKLVVRTMPNLALAKAKSITGVYAANQIDKKLVEPLLKLWGKVFWLDQEDEFNVFTAIAGSGPAYFFEVTRHLQKIAQKYGFSEHTAKNIANSTLESASAALGDSNAEDKVKAVASKGGVTEEALSVFARHEFGSIISEAIEAAMAKSRKLSK